MQYHMSIGQSCQYVYANVWQLMTKGEIIYPLYSTNVSKISDTFQWLFGCKHN